MGCFVMGFCFTFAVVPSVHIQSLEPQRHDPFEQMVLNSDTSRDGIHACSGAASVAAGLIPPGFGRWMAGRRGTRKHRPDRRLVIASACHGPPGGSQALARGDALQDLPAGEAVARREKLRKSTCTADQAAGLIQCSGTRSREPHRRRRSSRGTCRVAAADSQPGWLVRRCASPSHRLDLHRAVFGLQSGAAPRWDQIRRAIGEQRPASGGARLLPVSSNCRG